MKTALTACAVTAMACLTVGSCDFRTLYIEGETPVEVLVVTDWTQLGADPDGASIYFYPEKGGAPKVFPTNSVTRTRVSVPSGYYTVLVFNRSVDEYGTMKFDGMGTLAGAEAILEDKLFSWVGRSDTVGRTVYEPEEIVVGRNDHFYVRTIDERMQEVTKGDAAADTAIDSVSVKPLRMVYTGNVSVRVNGIQNVRTMCAYLTGMAGEAYLATRSAGDTLATHVLESWRMERDGTDYTKGYMKTSFSCFGLPEQYVSEPDPSNNRLVIQFSLVDGKTVVGYSIDVGAEVQQVEKELVVNFVVEKDNAGKAIVLPDVKPSGSSESGFDVDFKDWEAPIDIPVGI